MSKKGEVRKLNETQKVAISKLLEEIADKENAVLQVRKQWRKVVNEVSKDLKIPENERDDWVLTEGQDGFEYRPRPKAKEEKKK